MEEMDLAIKAVAEAQPLVGMWMNWMMVVMLLSILFIWKHKAARWVFASIFAVMGIALLIFQQTQNVHLIGIAHLIVWTPLAYYLICKEMKSADFKAKSIYGVWLILFTATIVISLLFDIRDIILVMMGSK